MPKNKKLHPVTKYATDIIKGKIPAKILEMIFDKFLMFIPYIGTAWESMDDGERNEFVKNAMIAVMKLAAKGKAEF